MHMDMCMYMYVLHVHVHVRRGGVIGRMGSITHGLAKTAFVWTQPRRTSFIAVPAWPTAPPWRRLASPCSPVIAPSLPCPARAA